MIRREFLAVALGGAAGTLLHGQPHQNFPSEPRKRLAVSSYPFRTFIVSRNKPGMTLEQFAASIPIRFGVTGIEPWSHHIQSTEPEYLTRVKQSFDACGVTVVNIPVDIRANFCSGEASERETAYTSCTKWIDTAVLLGSPSIRVHLPPPPISANYVECAAAGLKKVADYGKQKNILVNLENDVPSTEDPFRIVEIINRVDSPYLRALPDFCNSMLIKGSLEYNNRGLQAMFSLAYNISHVKTEEADGSKVYRIDPQKIFAIAKAAKYRGYFSMEFDAAGDPYEATKKLIAQSIQCLS